MTKITALPADTSPSTDDYTVTVDTGSGQTKKVLLSDLLSMYFNNAPSGTPVQIVGSTTTALVSGTALIPLDDTPPLVGEGTEFMTQSITPKSATNNLLIEAVFYGAITVGVQDVVLGLFQDAGGTSIAAMSETTAGTNYRMCLVVRHFMVAGTTSSTTFKIRGGPTGSGTLTMNGFSGARYFGAITKSSFTITEIKP